MRQNIEDLTYETRQKRLDIWEKTYERQHMRLNIKDNFFRKVELYQKPVGGGGLLKKQQTKKQNCLTLLTTLKRQITNYLVTNKWLGANCPYCFNSLSPWEKNGENRSIKIQNSKLNKKNTPRRLSRTGWWQTQPLGFLGFFNWGFVYFFSVLEDKQLSLDSHKGKVDNCG